MSVSARRNAVPIWSGSAAMPTARRAARRSSAGSTQVTSGARPVRSAPMILSHLSSVTRRSPISASQWSVSSAATSVRGQMLTGCPAIPAVGSGAVGTGTGGLSVFLPPQASSRTLTTPHAPRFKYLSFNGLVTSGNLSERQAAVHYNHLPGDMSRRVAAQKRDDARDVLRLRHASQDRFVLGALQHLARQLREELCLHESGRDRVDVDVRRAEVD